MFEPHSPIASYSGELIAGLTCHERPMTDLLIISAWHNSRDKLFAALGKKLKIEIPKDYCTATTSSGITIFKTALNRLTAVSENAEIFAPAQTAVTGYGVVSRQHHASVRLRLQGTGAQALLARGAPVDMDTSVFPEAAFAQTAIHRIPLIIHKLATEPETLDIYVPRSFAWAFRQWLADSAFVAEQAADWHVAAKTSISQTH